MRVKLIPTVTLLFLCLALPAAASDIEYGFRGIAWGTPLTAIKHLHFRKSLNSKTHTYIATNDNFRLGSIPLKRILYHFSQNDTLNGVDLIFSSADSDIVYSQIQALLGNPNTSQTRTAIWNSPKLKTVLTSSVTRTVLSIHSKKVDNGVQNNNSLF